MRVNVDDSALHEPRLRCLAKTLGIGHYEALGRIIHVWMLCYNRRTATVRTIDIDVAAELDGFAAAMITEELAEQTDEGVYVRGVTERIEFLERQADRGRKSGASRRNKSESNQRSTDQRTNVERDHERTLNERSRRSGTNSLSPDLDLSLTQALDLRKPTSPNSAGDVGINLAEIRTTEAAGIKEPRTASPALSLVPEGPGTPEQVKTPPGANGEHVKRVKPRPPPPPIEALTAAELLLAAVVMNHPNSRLARQPENTHRHTAEKWAESIDKIHRIDGLTWGEIDGMIMWCQKHSFWRTVILGADNLRDKWDKMAAQRTQRGQVTAMRGNAFDAIDEACADAVAKEQRT